MKLYLNLVYLFFKTQILESLDMKIWTFEYIFSYPWDTVVTAAIQKYPNPENDKVIGIDLISQQVHNGQLHSERILQTKFSVMSWASKVGFTL